MPAWKNIIRVVKRWQINLESAVLALPCHLHGQKNIIESESICSRSQFIQGVFARLCGKPPKANTWRVERRTNNFDQASE
jgi:hypothetical protein